MLSECWNILGQMAPYLLFGFLIAGVLSIYVSPQLVEKHLGGDGFWPIVKASLFGVPLPLCSCSILPVSASIRQHGASKAAVSSFLLSTPQTGVDSIAVTYGLLGPIFAVFRPLVALITGLIGGALVLTFDNKEKDEAQEEKNTCCESCCSEDNQDKSYIRALRYGFVTLPRDLGLALILGIIIAGAISYLVPEKSLAAYIGGGVSSILILMLAGVPLYVCATASVPIAAGFIHLGASPGAALAFLIAGPATNAAAFTTIWKVLGRKSAVIYLLTVAASAFLSGYLLDNFNFMAAYTLPQTTAHSHAMSNYLSHISAVILLLVLLYSYYAKNEHKE